MKKLTVVLMLAALVLPGVLKAETLKTKEVSEKMKQMQAALETDMLQDMRVLTNLTPEGKKVFQEIEKFRKHAENMLERQPWAQASKDPQELIKSKTNYIAQSLMDVVDEMNAYDRSVEEACNNS